MISIFGGQLSGSRYLFPWDSGIAQLVTRDKRELLHEVDTTTKNSNSISDKRWQPKSQSLLDKSRTL